MLKFMISGKKQEYRELIVLKKRNLNLGELKMVAVKVLYSKQRNKGDFNFYPGELIVLHPVSYQPK